MSLYDKRKATTRIILHCTASPEGRDLTAKDIDREHRRQGWAGIGYHFIVRLDGTVEAGRPVDTVGAHVAGYNATSIGISYVGCVDANLKAKDTRTLAQKESMATLVARLLTAYPDCEVLGHRDLSPDRDGNGKVTPDEWIKQCPCFDTRKWWATVKATGVDPSGLVFSEPYKVAAGDTLYSLARRFGTTVDKLAEASGVNPNMPLKVGQTLRVPKT